MGLEVIISTGSGSGTWVCGGTGFEYMLYDFDEDCVIDLDDLAELLSQWLKCNDPEDQNCIPNW